VPASKTAVYEKSKPKPKIQLIPGQSLDNPVSKLFFGAMEKAFEDSGYALDNSSETKVRMHVLTENDAASDALTEISLKFTYGLLPSYMRGETNFSAQVDECWVDVDTTYTSILWWPLLPFTVFSIIPERNYYYQSTLVLIEKLQQINAIPVP
jgi:hypothetical protein